MIMFICIKVTPKQHLKLNLKPNPEAELKKGVAYKKVHFVNVRTVKVTSYQCLTYILLLDLIIL